VILSAPATVALHVPVISLAPAVDTKDPKGSETSAFKNVFESLTLFEDLEQQGGTKQESDAAPTASAKKELPVDFSSGTETLIVPQITSPGPPKSPLTLSLSAPPSTPTDVGVIENTEISVETSQPQLPSPRPGNDVTETTSSPAELDLRAPISTRTTSTQTAQATLAQATQVTATPTSSKVLPVERGVEAQSTAVAQATAPAPVVTTQPAIATRSISLPLTATSVLVTTAEPGPQQSAQETTLRIPLGATRPTSSIEPAPSGEPTPIVKPTPSFAGKAVTAGTLKGNPVPVELSFANKSPRVSAPNSQPAAETKTPPSAQRSTFVKTAEPVAVTTTQGTIDAPAGDRNRIAPAPAVSNQSQAAVTPPSKPASAPPSQNTPATVPMSAADVIVPARTDESLSSTSSVDTLSNASAPAPVVEKRPEPMVAAEAPIVSASATLPAPTALPAPALTGGTLPKAVNNRASEPASAPAPPYETLFADPAPKTPLVPQAENFAFAVRMLGLDRPASHSLVTESKPVNTSEVPATQLKGPVTQSGGAAAPQPGTSQAQASNNLRQDPVSPTLQPEKSPADTQSQADSLRPQQKIELVPHANDTAVFQAPRIESRPAGIEWNEYTQANASPAAQESHLLAPDLPKAPASSEILLHLTDGDQSLASVRVADRAGSVNVSVHASDPVLRESLRTNLGELSTQLNQQGWRADVIRSAVAATHPEGQQDSRSPEQRGSQQQQSPGGDRQAQRERRGNGGQWRQELEQQTSGNDARPGGNR
jgi:hypothetical protein